MIPIQFGWISQDLNQVHFDAVVNLDKGLYVYPNEKRRYARSVRQYKILNCKNYHLTQVRTDFYDDFWAKVCVLHRKNKRNTQLA